MDLHDPAPDPAAERLHTLLLEQVRHEPPAPAVRDIVESCRASHRRRLAALGVIASCAAVLAALVPAALAMRGDDGGAAPASIPRSVAAMSDSQIVSTCRDGNQASEATALMFSAGTPQVRLRGEAAEMARVVLVSADGQYWASCFINLYAGAEFASGMEVYDLGRAGGGTSYEAGFTCKDLDGPPSPPCDTFMVLYVDRLPDEVAAVEFVTADGQVSRRETEDGFVLFQHVGAVPADYSKTRARLRQPYLTRVTYLDGAGVALAAQNMGGTDSARMRVGDLPLLTAFPSYRIPAVGSEPPAAAGPACPARLPQASVESHGFGTSKPATTSPTLPAPTAAAVCVYVAEDVGPGPEGNGVTMGWRQTGEPRMLSAEERTTAATLLRSIVPIAGERMCTQELGPRWVLVYAHATATIGVVVDGFGCRDVRLTDDPASTVPGQATRHGTVPGVLSAPPELLEWLQTLRPFPAQ